MKRIVRTAVVLLLASAVLGPAAADAQQPERYTLEGDLVGIHNLAGELTVRGGEGDAVTVEVARGGGDAGRLEVRTGSLYRFDASLRVVYPADRIRYGDPDSRTHLRVRENGTIGDDGGRRVRISGSGEGLVVVDTGSGSVRVSRR